MAIKIRCSIHPTYRAIRPPRVMCSSCWYLFGIAQHIEGGKDPLLQLKRGKKWNKKKHIEEHG